MRINFSNPSKSLYKRVLNPIIFQNFDVERPFLKKHEIDDFRNIDFSIKIIGWYSNLRQKNDQLTLDTSWCCNQ